MHSFPRTLLLLGALLGSASPALAQTSAEPAHAAGESAEYKRTIEAALDEYRLQHFEEARTLFQQAHALDPSARTMRGLGMVEFELRHYVAALTHLDAALASKAKPLTPEQRSSVEDLKKRAEQFIARYSLEVLPAQPGVRIELDGKLLSTSGDAPIALEAGEHTLRVSTPDTLPRELQLDVKGGEHQTLHIQLELKTADKAPVAELESAPARKISTTSIVLLGAGAAVVVVGGVLGGVALKGAKDADSDEGSDADRARSLALVSDVAIGMGVASVIAGGIVWLVQRKSASGESARVGMHVQSLQVRF